MDRTETSAGVKHEDPGLAETLVHETVEPANDAAPKPMPTGHARYTRGRELGRGGMGAVFEAIDMQFNRVVAVKHTSHDGASTRRRFATEALVTGHLEHPGIPSVYERGVDDQGRPFYAMRRVQGRTLAQLLDTSDTLAKRLVLLPIVTRVAQTIGFAHDRGVVHRDIKPDNILVGDHGETIVIDWGLARVRGVPVDPRQSSNQVRAEDAGPSMPTSPDATVAGAIVGTPAYMAPEQARGDLDRIDERTDVFALGALLYHVLVGDAPYRGTSMAELVDAAKAVTVAPIPREIPQELAAICRKAMALEPAGRYRNAHELASALEDFAARSVLGRPARAMQITTDVISVVLAILALVATFITAKMVSSPHQQGMLSYVTFVVGALGTTAGAVEWLTRGRYQLSPLVLALAGGTFLISIATTAAGLGHVFGIATEVPDPTEFRALVTLGLYEVFGALAIGAILTTFQLFVWAVARRRVLRAAAS